MALLHAFTRHAIAVYDRGYRLWHGLDGLRADVPPVLRIEVRRSLREHLLGGGVAVRRGDRVGVLHLDNQRVALLHREGATPLAVGLEFRRQFLASLQTLARLAAPGGRLADVTAFMAVTIFHRPLRRAGFEVETPGLVLGDIVAAYQRRFLALLHPAGKARLRRLASTRAERVWISRARLLDLHHASFTEAAAGRAGSDGQDAMPIPASSHLD
jgi:hypothetical protein